MFSLPRAFRRLCCFLLGFASVLSVRADVRLHGMFTDHMVLQRNTSVPVWGWADEGEEVEVVFRTQRVKTRAADGKWSVRLSSLKEGGPDSLIVIGKNTVTLNDVLVGEVWVASGQSNMEWPMRVTFEAASEMAKADEPRLRLFSVPRVPSAVPTNNLGGTSWQVCSPSSIPGFSAVAFYFGRNLQRALGVPVGLIHTSWGGTPAEAWMSDEALRQDPQFAKEIVEAYPDALHRFETDLANYEHDRAAAAASGKKLDRSKPWAPWRPSDLYNGMIAPVVPYAIQGFIWYQGESNAGRAGQYQRLFPALIQNWRKVWGQKELPFLLVQLAPFMAIQPEPKESGWAELREAQWATTKALPKVGMAVITDVGDEKDIHPRRKEPVGARLAEVALGVAYGRNGIHSGPEFASMKLRGSAALISFKQVGQGLAVKGERLTGFAMAGADRKFFNAQARIVGNRVLVECPQVPRPVAVRFGWSDFPVVNLWNKAGFPAVPFRTDDFPTLTGSKKP